jgi:hypothetical protein
MPLKAGKKMIPSIVILLFGGTEAITIMELAGTTAPKTL